MAETGAGTLLTLVRTGRAATRSELGQATGLSRTAVSTRVSALLEAGLLAEAGERASTGGRPPGALVFRAEAAVVVGVAVGRSRSQVAVFDLEGRIQRAESHDNPVGAGPDEVLPHVASRLAALLAESPGAPVLGVGMSLPGRVDPVRRVSVEAPVMRGWDGVPLEPFLAAATDAPLFLTNDTVALARAERLGAAELRNALVVKASTGLGLSLVLDGRLVAAERGVVGELGHTKVRVADGLLCRCGATGCLEAVAGGWALTQQLAETTGSPYRHVRDVVDAALDGDAPARAALRESGRLVGEVLAVAANLLNPDTVVVGGDMSRAFDIFSAGVRESVYGLSTPAATRDLTVRPSLHGEDAGLVGCAALVIDTELDPQAVDRRLAGLRYSALDSTISTCGA